MKKPKISLDQQKIQAFFLHHIEKILLVIVVGLMLMLILRGLRLPHLDAQMTPQGLVSNSESTKQYVDDPGRWKEVSTQGPRIVNFDVVRQVEKVQLKTEPLAYALPNSLNRPDFPKLSPRTDPELFAPINLVVRAIVGPLASYPVLRAGEEYVDPLYPMETDEQKKKRNAAEKAKANKKKKDDLAGGEGSMDGMPGGGRQSRAKKGKAAKGGEEGGEMPGGSGPRGGSRGMAGMPGGEGGGYGGGDGTGITNGLYNEALTFGFPVQSAESTVARDVASVTLMAVVPFQKQIEEFEKKLAESLDYDPNRDYPWYLDFRVQRADVTEVDPSTDIEKLPWKQLTAPATVLNQLVYGDERTMTPPLYAGVPIDVIDPNYTEPEVLTHPAPPYLQRDLWDLLTHPDVPLYSVSLQYGEAGTAGVPAADAGGDDAPTRRMPVGNAGGSGEGGMPGGGPMRGPPNRGGMPGGGMPGGGMPGGGGYGRGGGEGGMPGGGGYGRGGGGYGGGMPGGEGGYGSAQLTYTPPKFKLVRFTDTQVQRGRKYRYRIRVYLNDPNHPDNVSMMSPSAASLHGDVQKRIKELDAADAKKPKDTQTGLPARTSWVMSPWSEPSAIAELPPPERVLAVKVKSPLPQKIKIGTRDVEVQMTEPSAEALAVVFDPAKIADVPAQNNKVVRGSVLNFVEDTKVIHPVTKEIIDLAKYNVTTDALVADMMGGETIKTVSTGSTTAIHPLTALGELLVVDSQGNLHVQNEAQDVELLRRFSVPKEEKPKEKPSDDTGLDAPGGRPRRGN